MLIIFYRFDEALELLDNIIKVDETNSAARKRRIAILKAQGYIVEAIKELVDYLKKYVCYTRIIFESTCPHSYQVSQKIIVE